MGAWPPSPSQLSLGLYQHPPPPCGSLQPSFVSSTRGELRLSTLFIATLACSVPLPHPGPRTCTEGCEPMPETKYPPSSRRFLTHPWEACHSPPCPPAGSSGILAWHPGQAILKLFLLLIWQLWAGFDPWEVMFDCWVISPNNPHFCLCRSQRINSPRLPLPYHHVSLTETAVSSSEGACSRFCHSAHHSLLSPTRLASLTDVSLWVPGGPRVSVILSS